MSAPRQTSQIWSDRGRAVPMMLGTLAAISFFVWGLPVRAETLVTGKDETSESVPDEAVIDSDGLEHFSHRANRFSLHPELPGVRAIGVIEDVSGQLIPLLSVGGTLRQVPIGDIVVDGWRAIEVDRDSVEVSNGSQSLRFPFDRWKQTPPSTSEAQPQSAPPLENDESD